MSGLPGRTENMYIVLSHIGPQLVRNWTNKPLIGNSLVENKKYKLLCLCVVVRAPSSSSVRGLATAEQPAGLRHGAATYHPGARGAPAARATTNQQHASQTVMSLALKQSSASPTKLQSAR